MKYVLRVLALLLLLAGLYHLFEQFEEMRIASLTRLNYFLMIIGVFAVPIYLNSLAKRVDKSAFRSEKSDA